MEKNDSSRRGFFKTLIFSLGGMALFWRFMTPKAEPAPMLITVAKDDVPFDGALVFRQAKVAVVRDGNGYYAMDLTCTHLGCTVSVTPSELVCPCHGSRFDLHGNVLAGPANRSLKRLAVEESDTRLVVRG
jgi:cytochrome b6-f complex iron-sulfur subunit